MTDHRRQQSRNHVGTGRDMSFPVEDPLDLITRMVHAGEDRSLPTRSLTAPIYQSSVFAFDDPASTLQGADGERPPASYSRDHFPNVVALENAVADLEGAEDGYAVASGMAAISHIALSLLSQGDHLIIAEGSYCDTELLMHRVLARFGIRTSVVKVCDLAAMRREIGDRTRLIFVETISNPGITVCDLTALGALARERNVLLVVDNTFATPALCRPLEHGADLVVHSATKFLGGHHDLTAGVIVGWAALIAEIRSTGYLLGALLGALDAWLALRGIRTLGPRMSWVSDSARQVAAFLDSHSAVNDVSYPGLVRGNDSETVRRMLPDGCGGMMKFDLHGGAKAAEAVVRRLRLIQFAPSLGGTSSTICYPPVGTKGIFDPALCGGQLRLSVGLERVGDVIADLDQALSVAPVDDESPRRAGKRVQA